VRVHVDHVYAPRLKPVFQLVLAGYTAVEHNVVEIQYIVAEYAVIGFCCDA
jgi:hypothetical protein